ncbi:hypothetical protein JCGZ_17791 [Jatropha curcas]|uniref:SOUL heme-binding protein n=1 Tax=Jatropha curcas TaxID=180498 RepID=A0A067JUX5_JATCU|nr:heme-binding protein 2 [Jatropha curcas]KDP26633.1 hypothetical protein JCGZ_17791 [Jatropha curcas]
MENPFLTIAAIAFYLSVSSHMVFYGHAVESPKYTLIHSESDYEIRLYKDILWMSALLQGTSSFQFQKSTKDGFHRIYQYIHGANLNSSQLPMTAPVLTSITTSASNTLYYVKLFLSKGNPPQANPELNLQLDRWKAQCIAVRKFPGFAEDNNVKKEMAGLVASLNKHLTTTGQMAALDGNSSYTIAQYNSSRIASGRLNEVWIDVSGFNVEGCLY